MPRLIGWTMTAAASLLAAMTVGGMAHAAPFTLEAALDYPFVTDLTAAASADRIAWVRDLRGVRNVFVALGPDWTPRQVTAFTADDGQELTGLAFSPDGSTLVFVRGGDHDANWPAKGGLAPDPAASPEQPKVTIWIADPAGGRPARALGEGDFPAISAKGTLAFVRDHGVWTMRLDGKDGRRLFFDRGEDSAPQWSPDGTRLAFVSDRDDHAFIGVWSEPDRPLVYLAPSTGNDGEAIWSPNGAQIAFTRQPGEGGPPEPLLANTPRPWAIWIADAATGDGRPIWVSGKGQRDSHPEIAGAALHWLAGDHLAFVSEADGWPHLYVVPASGGPARLLTPGAFMVEDITETADRRTLVFSANAGATAGDEARRHLFAIGIDDGKARPLTAGTALQWAPTAAGDRIAFVQADFRAPPAVATLRLEGGASRILSGQSPPADFAGKGFVEPRIVHFRAADGMPLEGILFEAPHGARQPALVYVHGGPPRQMLLGWHYMDYYSNGYAVNQYLTAHGFTVLALNYRLGIGYGHDFNYPENAGPAGASEYQDVIAAAHTLQNLPGVDPARIGIWGGSYGGYLTALALARDSATFKAGVDMHGVHDWTQDAWEYFEPAKRYQQGDRAAALAVAWQASPDAAISTWRSPVLIIQGDDDRNVHFNQMIDLVRRLDAQGVPYESMVLPDEIHGFLRFDSWRRADAATVDFLKRKLAP